MSNLVEAFARSGPLARAWLELIRQRTGLSEAQAATLLTEMFLVAVQMPAVDPPAPSGNPGGKAH